jgi:hypothetical protein
MLIIKNIFLPFYLLLFIFNANAQGTSAYLKAHAIRVDDPLLISDSVYNLVSPFRVFMIGEMHGTNEPAEFVTGLAKLFANKGDSVSVGLEIPPDQMSAFLSSNTDSSIYQSSFFTTFGLDGRESFAWASVISRLKNNPKVQLFFFDKNENEGKIYERDSIMYLKIKRQIQLHPRWKTVTLCGNAHALASPDENKTAGFLMQDKELNLSSTFCTIGNYYLEGTSMGDFGHGFQEKKLGRPVNEYDTTFAFDKYFMLMSAKTTYPYKAMYYTKNITASLMAQHNIEIQEIKKELFAIHERDQKTRAHGDSALFMQYIDSCNLVQVESLIRKYGWMGKSLIGGYCNYTLWLVIQHAELPVQEKYLPLLEASVADSESRACDLAYLQDRVLMRQKKKQIYGSQIVLNKEGGQEFYPIEDEKNVNIRRKKAGLQPMEEYAKNFGIEYKLPSQ